ncbi:MAG: hypothetical protein J0I90_07975, partial [Nitrosospira sp.]|nr:hypothetical protein [Nitrosospira sp.]
SGRYLFKFSKKFHAISCMHHFKRVFGGLHSRGFCIAITPIAAFAQIPCPGNKFAVIISFLATTFRRSKTILLSWFGIDPAIPGQHRQINQIFTFT